MPNTKRILASIAADCLRYLLPRLAPGDRSSIARNLMHDRFDPKTRAFAGFCTEAIHAWKNRQYDFLENGESALLERLRPFKPRQLFDVGANVGDWSLAACKALPEARVDAFEIAPGTFSLLQNNLTGLTDRVFANGFGLGNQTGQITLHIVPTDNTRASIVGGSAAATAADLGDGPAVPVTAEIMTGDAYLAREGIGHIDLLKVDVEGAELAVIRGFSDAFARSAIDLVQFEYSQANLFTRDFLGDFNAFFARQGYRMGKLYPEGVAFKDYDCHADEDFIGPNYVACRAERVDIIRALACPPVEL